MPTGSVFFKCLSCNSRPIPAQCPACKSSEHLDSMGSPYEKKLQAQIDQLQTELNQAKSLSITPEAQQSELRTENQNLTTALALKETELNDCQAEIRALESQLSERENNQPSHQQIRKLATKLELVKKKLTE